MANAFPQPCDEGVIRARPAGVLRAPVSEPWILAATILGSSMAFIHGTVVNVALPALQKNLNATVLDVQWVVESYALFLAHYFWPADRWPTASEDGVSSARVSLSLRLLQSDAGWRKPSVT